MWNVEMTFVRLNCIYYVKLKDNISVCTEGIIVVKFMQVYLNLNEDLDTEYKSI